MARRENLTKERDNGTSERLILKDPEFWNNKIPRTEISLNESSGDEKRRKRNTINPAGLFEEFDLLPSRYARNSKVNPRKLFVDNTKVNNSDIVRDIFRRSGTKIESKPKRKSVSTRKERQEKSRLETSSESCTSLKNSQRDLISNRTKSRRTGALHGNDYTNMENISSKNVQRSSFHLRSPKLLLNRNKLSTSNPAMNSPASVSTATVSTGDGFEIGSSELTSSDDVSFSVQRIRFRDNAYYHHIPNSSTNDYPSTRDDQIYNQPVIQQNCMFPLNLQENISENDTTTFSDDGMSSVGYSPMDYNESPLMMLDCLGTNDVGVQMSNSEMLPSKSQNCDTDHEQLSFSLYSLTKEKYRCLSPNNERSLPFKKRQMQWNSLLDPLESALTTSMEKLNEIIGDL